MRKRERFEIIYDILKAIQSKTEAKPTHILYKSNLSTHMLKEYLGELLDKGFIVENEYEKGKKTYSLTDKGHRYLEDFKVISSFLESYGLDD
mgnify:CR=1 FL=1